MHKVRLLLIPLLFWSLNNFCMSEDIEHLAYIRNAITKEPLSHGKIIGGKDGVVWQWVKTLRGIPLLNQIAKDIPQLYPKIISLAFNGFKDLEPRQKLNIELEISCICPALLLKGTEEDFKNKEPKCINSFLVKGRYIELFVRLYHELRERNQINIEDRIYSAIEKSNYTAVALYLSLAPHKKDKLYSFPIWRVCKRDSIAKLLLSQGYNLNQSDHMCRTPLYNALDHMNFEVAKELLDKGANQHELVNDYDGSFFLDAWKTKPEGEMSQILEFLKKYKYVSNGIVDKAISLRYVACEQCLD